MGLTAVNIIHCINENYLKFNFAIFLCQLSSNLIHPIYFLNLREHNLNCLMKKKNCNNLPAVIVLYEKVTGGPR